MTVSGAEEAGNLAIDATEPVERLLRDLRHPHAGCRLGRRPGASSCTARTSYGAAGGHLLARELLRQFVHPLALLLWAAAGLAVVAGIQAIAIAIVVVIVLTRFAFFQRLQAGGGRSAPGVPASTREGAPRRRRAGHRGCAARSQ